MGRLQQIKRNLNQAVAYTDTFTLLQWSAEILGALSLLSLSLNKGLMEAQCVRTSGISQLRQINIPKQN